MAEGGRNRLPPPYDGVHMDFKTAIRFSRHLAGLIAQTE